MSDKFELISQVHDEVIVSAPNKLPDTTIVRVWILDGYKYFKTEPFIDGKSVRRKIRKGRPTYESVWTQLHKIESYEECFLGELSKTLIDLLTKETIKEKIWATVTKPSKTFSFGLSSWSGGSWIKVEASGSSGSSWNNYAQMLPQGFDAPGGEKYPGADAVAKGPYHAAPQNKTMVCDEDCVFCEKFGKPAKWSLPATPPIPESLPEGSSNGADDSCTVEDTTNKASVWVGGALDIPVVADESVPPGHLYLTNQSTPTPLYKWGNQESIEETLKKSEKLITEWKAAYPEIKPWYSMTSSHLPSFKSNPPYSFNNFNYSDLETKLAAAHNLPLSILMGDPKKGDPGDSK